MLTIAADEKLLRNNTTPVSTTLRLTGMTALSSHAAHNCKISSNVIRCNHIELHCHTAGHFAPCIGRPERQS